MRLNHLLPFIPEKLPLSAPYWRVILSIASMSLIMAALLWALGYFYGIYPIGAVEQLIDPHMYYIRQFVHSLPPEVQADMTMKAAALNLDIYSYNLQMCTLSDDYFK